MAETIDYRFVVKRDLAANFTTKNTLLLSGEYGLETDTRRIKMGDGTTYWTSLAYYAGEFEAIIHAAAAHSSPANADEFLILDSTDGYSVKKINFANLAAAVGSGGGGGGGTGQYTYADPSFANVSSLHHFEGANNSTVFTDQVSGNTWTGVGGAQISTGWFSQGASSLLIAGSGNSAIYMPTNSKFNVGAGDWTIQFTYKYVGTPQTSARVFQTKDGDVYAGIGLNMNSGSSAQVLSLYMSSNASSFDIANNLTLGTLPTSSPTEVLVERLGQIIYCFFNGFLVAQVQLASSTLACYYNASDRIIIGGNSTGTSRSMNAYMDEFRFTKGSALLVPNRAYPSQPAFPDS